MEENEYKKTYNAINQRRCVFEKAILSRRCDCALATRFYLADREGIGCSSAKAQSICQALLQQLRKNAMFALKVTHIGASLPHAKEIKVQNGGVLGLQHALYPEMANDEHVADIQAVVTAALTRYGGLEEFPFAEIVKAIVAFEGRRKRPRPAPDN
ncbi:MAG: hypothetical protein V3S33_02100 [Gammaproteobacteria bacterium]